uniref:Down syndrome cell adhesion molecule-like protein Dscam2 n=1 Tax=Timema poppense TaxID=170557 RepID=A0A7R9CWA1_TIMPO|nr:unnamed protein product [Timema poppensis]
MGISTSKMGKRGSSLLLDPASSGHRGNYTCTVRNRAGTVNFSTSLEIHVLPHIIPFRFDSPIFAGQATQVTCLVSEGDLPLDILWSFQGTYLSSQRSISTTKISRRGSLLLLDPANSGHTGNYSCTVRNPAGTVSFTTSLEIHVLPLIVPFHFDSPIFAGQATQVTCLVSQGDAPLNILWSFQGSELSTQTGISTNKFGRKASSLLIDPASSGHRGNYTCTVKNPAGTVNYTAHLEIHVPPRWILEPTDKAFAQGSDAKVECKADGFPKPQVTWKRAAGETPGDYKDLKPNNPNIKVEDGTLTINNIQKTNEGYYLCEAVNGIGSGLSAVILISVQAPPHFEIKLRNQTSRRGEPTVLQCEARGEKPIGILWNMNNKRLDPKSDNRYTIREEILPNGVLSDLSIKRTERTDSALFTCVATNAFGSDDTSINMIVQEVPEVPYGLKVLDKSGRSVQLSWAAPYDGNSPIKRYIIEYKISKGTWEVDIDRVLVPGQQNVAGVFNLKPATTYHLRIVAENEIGSSDPSDTVTIITAEEAPSGPPSTVKVEAEDQHTLKISWKPPERDDWNGEILGYYVGYREASSEKPYLFETVEFSKEEGKEHHLKINELKTYAQYSVVVQAFNKVGAGPMSEEVRQYTAEGIPEQPPQDTTCTTLTSQTIRVSWVSPPLTSANGVIKGYKVVYGPSDTWYDENSKDTKITSSSETILHGLKKYTNYSMQVLAFTSGGDGVRSSPIHCQTEQDVPEAPSAVKALVMSGESILVSWKPPEQPNGVVVQYTVYVREIVDEGKEAEPKSQKVPPFQMSYEASSLKKKERYEFWVTASTVIGEGQPSKPVSLSPSNRVPAKIASFDDAFTATYKEDVKLPCLAVGVPAPDIQWKVKGVAFQQDDHIRQLPEGSLFIKSVTRQDAGEYSCSVENSFGHDTITHQLVVHAPPHSPQVTLTSTTTTSITMKLRPHATDTAPLHGYTVHYKPEFGEWETVQVNSQAQTYTLEGLWCGSRYQIYVTAYNGIGTGEQSDNLNTRTKGSKPVIPEAGRFIEVSTNSITLHLSAWSDGGCPMLYFVVEHKKRNSLEWNQISNNVKPGGNFVVLDLDPANWYHLRVTAHNNAGFTVAEYEFATLTITGGTIAPARELPDQNAESPITILMSNLNLVVPVASALLVIIIAVIVICVMRGKSNHHKDDVVYNQSAGGNSTMDKRRPDLRDELGYIAPPNRKLPPVPGSNYNTCDRIKRGHSGSFRNHATWDPRHPRNMYEELTLHPPNGRRIPAHPGSDETMYHRAGMEDEICPYATFHLLGFREEMDPNKAMQFQTFPHQNGHERTHSGTMGPIGGSGVAGNGHVHQRSGSQSMFGYLERVVPGCRWSLVNLFQPRANGRYSRVANQNGPTFSPGPEYDDPANCAPEEDQYGSQYGQYGAPYDHYGSRGSVSRRSVEQGLGHRQVYTRSSVSRSLSQVESINTGVCWCQRSVMKALTNVQVVKMRMERFCKSLVQVVPCIITSLEVRYCSYGSRHTDPSLPPILVLTSLSSARNLPMAGSPEPPPPPPRNHDPNNSSSFNDSKESNEISEAECDRDQLVNRNYGVNVRANSKDLTTEEMRKLIESLVSGVDQSPSITSSSGQMKDWLGGIYSPVSRVDQSPSITSSSGRMKDWLGGIYSSVSGVDQSPSTTSSAGRMKDWLGGLASNNHVPAESNILAQGSMWFRCWFTMRTERSERSLSVPCCLSIKCDQTKSIEPATLTLYTERMRNRSEITCTALVLGRTVNDGKIRPLVVILPSPRFGELTATFNSNSFRMATCSVKPQHTTPPVSRAVDNWGCDDGPATPGRSELRTKRSRAPPPPKRTRSHTLRYCGSVTYSHPQVLPPST